ncbi:MAG TPA: hypothetical protein VF782_00295 [Allosphingosinicella sp.]|jgi:hypothetical protein
MPELGDQFGSFFEAAATLALLFIIVGWVSSKLVGLAQTALNSHGKMLWRELRRCFGGDEAKAFTRYFYWHPLLEPLSQPPTMRRLRAWLPKLPRLSRSPQGYPDGRLPAHIAPETFAAAMLNPFPWPTTNRSLRLVLAGNPPEPADNEGDPSPEQFELARTLASARERVEGAGTWGEMLGEDAAAYDAVFGQGPVNIHFHDPAAGNLLARLRESWRTNRLVPAAARSRIMAILDDSEGDMDRMRESLGRWYSEMMDRVTARFKRRALLSIFAVALALCFLFNIDSIHIFQEAAKRTPGGGSETAGPAVSKLEGERFNSAYENCGSNQVTETCSRELLAGLWRDPKSADLIRVLADTQPSGRTVEVADRVEQLRPVRNWCRSEKRAELCGDSLMGEMELCIAGVVPPASPGMAPQALPPEQLGKVCGAAWRGLFSSPALFWDPAAANALAGQAFGTGSPKDPGEAVSIARKTAERATRTDPPDPALPGVSALFFNRVDPFPNGFEGFLGMLLSAFLATLGAPFWYDLLGRISRRGASGAKP